MDIAALAAELAAGHPDTGAYNADAELAANELNAINRDAPADSMALLNYCIMNDFRGESVYGRVALVAASSPGDSLPLDDAETGLTMTIKHVAAAKAFLRFLEPDVQSTDALTASGWDSILNALAGGGANAQCMGPTQKAGIVALSQNQQSRASEIGLGRVKTGHVIEARA